MRDNRRGPVQKCSWTAEEDQILMELVSIHGPKKWSLIATSLCGRIGKQCRERWHNHLNPEVRKDAWSTEEDALIFELVEKHGTKWATIAKALQGRTDNAIKNRYYSSLKKFHDHRTRKTSDGSLRIPSRVKTSTKRRRPSTASTLTDHGSPRHDTVSESSAEDILSLGQDVIERSPKTCSNRFQATTHMPTISHLFSLNSFSDRASPCLVLPQSNASVSRVTSAPIKPNAMGACVRSQRRLLPLHRVHSHALVQQTVSLNKLYGLQQQQQARMEAAQMSNPMSLDEHSVAPEVVRQQEAPPPMAALHGLEELPLLCEYESLLYV